jgi:hypothetical protein
MGTISTPANKYFRKSAQFPVWKLSVTEAFMLRYQFDNVKFKECSEESTNLFRIIYSPPYNVQLKGGALLLPKRVTVFTQAEN